MRKSLLSLWLFLITTAMFGQSTTLVQPSPIPAVCTGDTLTFVFSVTGSDYDITGLNHFTFEVSETNTFLIVEDLPAVKFTPSGGTTGFPNLDTNTVGSKIVKVIIPPTYNPGLHFLRITSTSPVTTSANFLTFNVNQTPESEIINVTGPYFDNIFTGTPGDLGMCLGDTLIVYAVESQPYYVWEKNGSPIPGMEGASYDSLLVTTSGVYSIMTALNSFRQCPNTSEDTLINIFIPPSATSFLSVPSLDVLDHPINNGGKVDSLRFCISDSIILTGPTTNVPGASYNYQWLSDSLDLFGNPVLYPITGANAQTYSTNVSGNYWLEVTAFPGGCIDTTDLPIRLFVDTIPDTYIVNQPWPGQTTASLTICDYDSVHLVANDIVAYSEWDYQWQLMYPLSSGVWQNIPNDTTYELTVSMDLVPDSALFRIYVRNQTCDYTTNPVQVNFIDPPTVKILPADSLLLCDGDSILVGVQGNGLAYSWNNGLINQASFYVSQPGVYVLKAEGFNSCETYDTLKVYQQLVNANAGPDQSVPMGTIVQLGASGGTDYYWYADKPAYFSNIFDPNTTTQVLPAEPDTVTYYVEVTSTDGCVGIDSMQVFFFDPSVVPGQPDLRNVQNTITPNGDGKNDFLVLSEVFLQDACAIHVLNRWGAEVYYEEVYTNSFQGLDDGGNELPDGTYYFMLTCGDEVRYKGAVTIIRNK